jgi:serine/threonine protein kinase
MSEQSATEAIFFAALEKPSTAERAVFLNQACAGDEALRRRVERLLASQGQVGAFLERPVVEAADLAAFAPPEAPGQNDSSSDSAGLGERQKREFRVDFLGPSERPDSLGRLGHYEMLEVVGRGGMGIVLRAFDETLHRVVAIKVLAPELAKSARAREHFVREAQATAAISHDHVIAIYAVEDAGAVPYLVMPFIDGPTLQERIDRSGPPALNEILRIGRQIAEGLAAAHAQGLVHRDVKPANILLENGVERVKITDLGLARAFADVGPSPAGIIAGTPAYMSPEQARGEAIDHRSDLFSLGSVLYALCTGRAPFQAATTSALVREVRDAAPRRLREVDPEIPAWLEAVIARLHTRDPGGRFQTAAEVADVLSRLLARLQQGGLMTSLAGRQSDSAQGATTAQVRGTRSNAVLLLVGITMLAVGVGANSIFRNRYEALIAGSANRGSSAASPARLTFSQDESTRLNSAESSRGLRETSLVLPASSGGGQTGRELIEYAASAADAPFRIPHKGLTHWMAQTGRMAASSPSPAGMRCCSTRPRLAPSSTSSPTQDIAATGRHSVPTASVLPAARSTPQSGSGTSKQAARL